MYDPLDEVLYGGELAKKYLEDAQEAYRREDWRGSVASAQLATENAAKAIIAIYRTPSWSHDPSDKLYEITSELPHDIRSIVRELAKIAHTLAPEHARTTYGDPIKRLTPWQLYNKEDSERAINLARRAVEIMEEVLKRMGIRKTQDKQ